MKYILLAYADRAGWKDLMASWDPKSEPVPEAIQAACDFYERLHKELIETGEFVATQGLADPSFTKTVRKTDGAPVAMDGPHAESKEVLVSFVILDCATYDRAVEIAARVVDFTGETIEVRPVPDGPAPPEL
jgi:hypothetical protein